MGTVNRVAGTAGTFTYTLNVVPDAPPTVALYTDPARTVLEHTATVDTTADPAAFLVNYPATLPAGNHYLTVTTAVAGVTHVDTDDVLVLVPITGGVGDSGPPPWQPTVNDVENLLPRRAPFTATSRPSTLDVAELVEHITGELLAELTGPLPERLHGLARGAAAYGAAALVEQAHHPEQSFGDDAAASALYSRYTGAVTRLRALAGALGLTLDRTGAPGAGGTVDGARTYRVGTVRTPSAAELAALPSP